MLHGEDGTSLASFVVNGSAFLKREATSTTVRPYLKVLRERGGRSCGRYRRSAHQISVLEFTAALVSISAKELASPTSFEQHLSETFADSANFFITANPFQYPRVL